MTVTRPAMRWRCATVIAWLVAAWCTAAAGVVRAQPQRLAPDEEHGDAIEPTPPVIELATFGVGERIFEKFGHTALCLRYHQPEHPEVCFNYGVTNFDAGGEMVWNFLRTKQRFWVEPTSLASMVRFYTAEDRDIWMQTLPIEGAQARAVEAKLWSDIQEANRYYYYDHFFDNCTTRLRDILDAATGGALRSGSDARYPLTFREIGRPGLAEWPALQVASDLVAGRRIDEYPTLWEAMFHPEVFKAQVAERFHTPARLINKRLGPAFPADDNHGRLAFAALGLVFVLPLVVAQWRRRGTMAALAWLAVELFVLGALVWGLVIISSIPAVRYNEAVLVVMPFDVALPWLGERRRRRYATLRLGGIAAVALLAAIGVLHQPLWALLAVVTMPMAVIALDLPARWSARAAVDATHADIAEAAAPAGAAVDPVQPENGASEAEQFPERQRSDT